MNLNPECILDGITCVIYTIYKIRIKSNHPYSHWFAVEKFLVQEGPVLLEMRVKQLIKDNQLVKAAVLAKTCSQCTTFQGKGSFKQMYLVCICATSERDQLMEEVSAALERMLLMLTQRALQCVTTSRVLDCGS